MGYGVAGGVEYAYSDHTVECAITEPQNFGAVAVIEPASVVMGQPEAFTALVTNTFPVEILPAFTG
jgi:hypothetical protein